MIVVGGGISGLAAGLWLTGALGGGRPRQPGMRLTLLEAADDVGGKLRLGELAGLPVDVGAESLLARRPEAVDLVRQVGLAHLLVSADVTRAAVLIGDTLRPFPARTVMGVPGDLAELTRSHVLSRSGLARVALDRLLPGRPVTGDVSVASYVGGRMGREVVDRLVEPLLGGVYAGRASELSFLATMGSLVPYASRSRSLLRAASLAVRPPTGPSAAAAFSDGTQALTAGGPVSRHPASGDPASRGHAFSGLPPADPAAFVGLEGGVAALAPACRARLIERGADVRTGATVRGIARDEGGWTVSYGSQAAPTQARADGLILAVPAPTARRLLARVDPVAAREIAGIDVASVVVACVAFPASASASAPGVAGSGYLVPAGGAGLVKAVTWTSNKWRWVRHARPNLLLARASIGRHGDDRALQLDDERLLARVVAEVAAQAGLRARPVDAVLTRWGGGLPQYVVGHPARVERIRRSLRTGAPPVEVCGAAFDGVGVPACIASGVAAAERLVHRLGTGDTMAT